MMTHLLFRSKPVVLLLLAALPCLSLAKKISGDFKLSGVNTEHILGKFALSPHAHGKLELQLSTKQMYEDDGTLRLHLYCDDTWTKWQAEPLCTEKVQLYEDWREIKFDFDDDDKLWKAQVDMPLDQIEYKRSWYWYVVVDDCSLEQYGHDSKIPELHYELTMWNDLGGYNYHSDDDNGEKVITLTHLSADEVGQTKLHTVTLLISLLVTAGMAFTITSSMVGKAHTAHAALFWVGIAAACDAASSVCELIHMKWYESNGVGSYFLDAASSYWEAICDSLVAVLLLSIASGWTLPNDVIHQDSVGGGLVQSLTQGFRNPLGAMTALTPAGVVLFSILGIHAILAQWGRIYNDDFSSYHDLEHLPGKILMWVRIFLGILLVICCIQTRSRCPLSLQRFYQKLSIVGTIWFQSLPAVTWFCSTFLPYYMIHPAVATGGGMVQSASLLMLAWLVTAETNSSFHKVSRLSAASNRSKGDFTDSLSSSQGSAPNGAGGRRNSSPTSWSFGKAKVRLD